MVAWRVARSLVRLIDQADALWPNRSKVSDGTIGDAEHATRDSDHNPWYGPGIVTAADLTHDPRHGADMHELAASLVASRDRRIKYLIWNRRILSGAPGPAPWVWRAYTGPNPHTGHLHLSVVASPLCDDTAAWRFPVEDDDMFEPTDRNRLIHVDDVLSKNNIAGRVNELSSAVVQIQSVLAALNTKVDQLLARQGLEPGTDPGTDPAAGAGGTGAGGTDGPPAPRDSPEAPADDEVFLADAERSDPSGD